MPGKRWRLCEPPSDEMKRLFPELPPVVAQLLWNRGCRDQVAVDEFLLPDYGQDLHDPFLFREMRRASERVWRALQKGEKIVIYSDYDADGVTGAAVLATTWRAAAAKLGQSPETVASYIPHREKEGYGLKSEAVEALCREGAKLIVTVDCGISNAVEIARARECGADVIVVDHHHLPERLPDAILLHPDAPGETYPYKHLAAVGVAFKFACGFIAFAREQGQPFDAGFDKWLLDLVAIATVTDFMPLLGENRTLEKYGLIVLNKTRRPGLRKLIEAAGLELGRLDTHAVGFQIGPRINAASRMDHANRAFETLMAPDDAQAAILAAELNRLNAERQRYGDEIYAAARVRILEAGGRRIQAIAGEGWSAGIVGLIAGKLVTEFGVPVFIFGRDGNRFTGSGRSIPEFDVMEALQAVTPHLARFGGHSQACGLTIEGQENFDAFVRLIGEFAERKLAGLDLRPVLTLDADLQLSEIGWDLVEWLAKFEPFGEGNQKPKFLVRDLQVISQQIVGRDGRHVRLGVRGDRSRETKLIGFGLAQAAADFLPGSRIDAAVEIGINEWNGNREIQLKMVDLRPAVGSD